MPSDNGTLQSAVASGVGRRRFLAFSTSAAVAGFAGCTHLMNSLGSLVLDDVNLFNETNEVRAGSIQVTDPNDEPVLDEQFELAASDEEDDAGSEGTDDPDENGDTTYGDVLTDAGAYTITLDLDEDSEINGVGSAERSVDVTAPADEHIVVGLGVGSSENPIEITVIEELSDLEDAESSS
ncbi:hypothetical protein KY092_14765 [Natronomonas gomsonensis]|uniref:hypothetical protein n=1 Tax=Natronomonas gomsonensis TaxID=1046043 RepID=UPI0020CA333E|nr:hypothetical protein [Natronomonas gomsonensis]MCY4731819.1 hypothetical protein [Natronomonas gomsonensis]